MKKYIRIFLALSIFSMQTGNAFASIFLTKKNDYIQICTSYGIKFIKSEEFKDSDITYNRFNLMNCCLDINNSLIFNSYISVNFFGLTSFTGNKIEAYKKLIKIIEEHVRAPPLIT